MPRAIWKGAISFGLVHVPVALYPASQESGIDFDWLDKRTMDPVGYKRVNKRTGKEIDKDDIVKGIKQDDGNYVVLSDEQIRNAYPKSTQTIELERFVEASEIQFTLLEAPYYLTPLPKAEKVYSLLREAMRKAGVIGIARVVMHTKERLCVLVPTGPALMLNTIRWADEIRGSEELNFPPDGARAAGLKEAELKMATQLIGEMTQPWTPADFSDKFVGAIQKLVAAKVASGDTEAVEAFEEAPDAGNANVVDLTALLKKSLGGGGAKKAPPASKRSRASAARKTA